MEINLNPIPDHLAPEKKNVGTQTAHIRTLQEATLIAFIATTRRPFPRGTSSIFRIQKLMDDQFTIVGAPLVNKFP